MFLSLGRGYPHPDLAGVTLVSQMGYPHPTSWMGSPMSHIGTPSPNQPDGVPPINRMGVPPYISHMGPPPPNSWMEVHLPHQLDGGYPLSARWVTSPPSPLVGQMELPSSPPPPPPQCELTNWKQYLPHPSDAGGNKSESYMTVLFDLRKIINCQIGLVAKFASPDKF